MNSVAHSDDLSITDEDSLLRRIPIQPDIQIIWNANIREWRPSSAAFNDHPDGSPMSIDICSTLIALGYTPADALTGYTETHGLVSFNAQVARRLNQRIMRQPLPDAPAHGIVIGNKTKAVRRNLASASEWVVPPDLPSENPDTHS